MRWYFIKKIIYVFLALFLGLLTIPFFLSFFAIGGTQLVPIKYAETRSAREQLREVNRHFGIPIEKLLILTSLLDIQDIYIEPIYLEFIEIKIMATILSYRKPINLAECQCGNFEKDIGCVCGYIVLVDKKQDDKPQVYTGREPIESYIGDIISYEPSTVIDKINEKIPKNTINSADNTSVYYEYNISLRPSSDYRDIVIKYTNDEKKSDEIIKLMESSVYNGILDLIEKNEAKE